jgi:hypothetical protein
MRSAEDWVREYVARLHAGGDAIGAEVFTEIQREAFDAGASGCFGRVLAALREFGYRDIARKLEDAFDSRFLEGRP